MVGMVYMLFQFFLVRGDKTLVNRKAGQGDPVEESMFLDLEA